jgi:hypothetical protein
VSYSSNLAVAQDMGSPNGAVRLSFILYDPACFSQQHSFHPILILLGTVCDTEFLVERVSLPHGK